MKIKDKNSGFVLIAVLVTATLFLVMAGGMASVGLYQNRLYSQEISKHQSIHIAEAGVNYYRWHLAHDPDDFMDGTGSDPGGGGQPYGPYIHDFTAPGSNSTGKYSLEITPPVTGSTIVKIKSTGWLDSYPNVKRTIEVRYGIPSLAHYSFLTNTNTWFGVGENVVGEMHSNGGIRMDGINDSIVTSARQDFSCPVGFGCNTQATCESPCSWITASSTCQCPAIFGEGPNSSLWNYPVPNINFNSMTMVLSEINDNAGVKLTTSGSNKGYHIIFKSDGHFDARLVKNLQTAERQYNDSWTGFANIAEDINSEGPAVDYAIPANGLIFVENGDVWVEGTVNGRVTLGAGTFPDNASKRRSIFIKDNLRYLARDGSNSLGLMAQQDVKILKNAPSNLVIDGILLAQNGRVFRNYYETHALKNNIEVYGGIITNQTWTWSWTSGGSVIDGYATSNSIYDPNLTYSPPPSFPTSGEYAFISWEEK